MLQMREIQALIQIKNLHQISIYSSFCKGSLSSWASFPRQRGHVGLCDFQALMHSEWKYFLQVPHSYKCSVSFSISQKQITQVVSSLRSISLEFVSVFYSRLFNLLNSCSSKDLNAVSVIFRESVKYCKSS